MPEDKSIFRPCQHRGEEIGYMGCSCAYTIPVYYCLIYEKPCAHFRTEPGRFSVTNFDGTSSWFDGHNPTCNTCQAYEPQRKNVDN